MKMILDAQYLMLVNEEISRIERKIVERKLS